jgi:hypothetical protein
MVDKQLHSFILDEPLLQTPNYESLLEQRSRLLELRKQLLLERQMLLERTQALLLEQQRLQEHFQALWLAGSSALSNETIQRLSNEHTLMMISHQTQVSMFEWLAAQRSRGKTEPLGEVAKETSARHDFTSGWQVKTMLRELS